MKMGDMIIQARMIADLCNSGFASDKELMVLSENFHAEFGCNWTEVLN